MSKVSFKRIRELVNEERKPISENPKKMDKMKDEEFLLYLDKMSDADRKKHKKAIEKRMATVSL